MILTTLKYLFLIVFIGLAFNLLLQTPKEIKADAINNISKFKTEITFIDSFQHVNQRLPFKNEFYSWQVSKRIEFDSLKLNVCYDTICKFREEDLRIQYLRRKKDFESDARFQLKGNNWCENYGLSYWAGDDWIYFLSWNKSYSNEYSWSKSIIGSLIYIAIGSVPMAISTFRKQKKAIHNEHANASPDK
jgi:hypothetical protein